MIVVGGPARVQVKQPGNWRTLWRPYYTTVLEGMVEQIVRDFSGPTRIQLVTADAVSQWKTKED